MSDLEGPNKKIPATRPPQTGPEWLELEQTPRFRIYFLEKIKDLFLEKKFGEDFYWNYIKHDIRRAFEDGDGNYTVPKNNEELENTLQNLPTPTPLIPEIHDLEMKLEEIYSAQDVIAFAQTQNVQLTKEDIEEAKRRAIQVMGEIQEEDD